MSSALAESEAEELGEEEDRDLGGQAAAVTGPWPPLVGLEVHLAERTGGGDHLGSFRIAQVRTSPVSCS
jgi:hypothetical protein